MQQSEDQSQMRSEEQVEMEDSARTNKKQQLKGYQFVEVLGKGTFGKVKAAIHLLSGQKVAIKIIDRASIKDEKDYARVEREIQILKIMRHPNIVQLYEVIKTDLRIYIIMEYIEQGQLFTLLSEQIRLNERASGRIFIQLMNAVEYLHCLGVAHRDLKPQNILLDQDLNVKLVDFGLSNFTKNNRLLETACGSPCYAPPEMLSGKNYDGKIGDIWSLGIIFYAMICGTLPFEQKTTKKLYKKVIEGFFVIPSDISLQAIQVIQSLLTPNPTKRIKIPQIRKLPFFEELKKVEVRIYGIIIGFHPMPIEFEIIEKMKEYLVFDKQLLEEQIKQNQQTPLTTLYYLLQRKTLKETGNTIIDLQIFLQSHQKYKQQYGFFPESSFRSLEATSKAKKRDYDDCQLRKVSKVCLSEQQNPKVEIKSAIKKAQFQKRFHSKIKIANRKALTKEKRKPLSNIKNQKNSILSTTKKFEENFLGKNFKFYEAKAQNKGLQATRLHTFNNDFRSTIRSKDSQKQRQKSTSQKRNLSCSKIRTNPKPENSQRLAINLWDAYFQKPLKQSIKKAEIQERQKHTLCAQKRAKKGKRSQQQQDKLFIENMRRLKDGFLNLSKKKTEHESETRNKKEHEMIKRNDLNLKSARK